MRTTITCPRCGSDNSAAAASCDNCEGDLLPVGYLHELTLIFAALTILSAAVWGACLFILV